MKKHLHFATALGIGSLTAVLSYFRYVDLGDFSSRGFPFPFLRGVWGMGMSYEFSAVALIADVLIWSLVWFLIIKLLFRIRRNAQ